MQIVEFEIQGKHLECSVKPDRGQAFIIILIKERHTTYYAIGGVCVLGEIGWD